MAPSGRGLPRSGWRSTRNKPLCALIWRAFFVCAAGSFRHTSCATSLSEGGYHANANTPININLSLTPIGLEFAGGDAYLLFELLGDPGVGKRLRLVRESLRCHDTQTVEENLILGAYVRRDREKIAADMEYVYDLFPRLKERKLQTAGTLSGGEQQMLAMGRALMSDPKIILMDEPSMGLAPILVDEIFKIIVELNKAGVTILLVEQNAERAASISDRVYLLSNGRVEFSGKAEDMANAIDVAALYMGGKEEVK